MTTAVLTPIEIAALGASFDVLPTADAFKAAGSYQWMQGAPGLMVADVLVTSDTDLQLYRWNAVLGRWVKAASEAVSLDASSAPYELRFNLGGIAGHYLLVTPTGTDTDATYTFSTGAPA